MAYPPSPTTPATPKKTADDGTGYVVLKQVPNSAGKSWEKISDTAGHKSAEAAIRSVVSGLSAEDQGGTFVAVPLRSWKAAKVSAKVTTALVIEGVDA